MRKLAMLACAIAMLFALSVTADAEVVLAERGESAYQVVVPDESPTDMLAQHLRETGELIQRAFAANGAEVPVVSESERDTGRPGVFIGDTRFARANGVDVSRFQGWTYAHKVVGRDVIIAGRDVPAPLETDRRGRRMGTQMGTMKGVADFLRDYAGVRFLYPDGDTGIEFMPTSRIAVPDDLNLVFEPRLRFNFFGRFGSQGIVSVSQGAYFVANNYFPNIAFEQHPHTYDRAIPVSQYRETNPEYFAMFGDKRTVEFLPESRSNHYCVSNPEVQELIYQDMLEFADRGYQMVVLGQQDGFRPCSCEDCHALYGTGDDWGEKLWLFHRELAERFKEDRPDKMIITLIYGPTRLPPKSFREFPDNLMMRMRMEGLERLEPWEGYSVPAGIFGALGLWGGYRALGYTPQVTPLRAASLAKQYCSAGLAGFYLDGFGNMFGMEGPTYYVFGRMFDDPEGLEAKDLLEEYYEAAFREALPPMRRFFEVLHQALQLNIDIPPSYVDEYGRSRGYRLTPLKRMRTIYSPDVLSDLEASLAQAESLATSPKVKSRLALIRHELNYTKHIAVIGHLYEAYLVAPSHASREMLLDAIDARNSFMDTLYDDRGNLRANLIPGWPEHRLLTGVSRNAARAPRQYRESPLTWDTEQMRRAPLPGAERLAAALSDEAITLESPLWDTVEAVELAAFPKDGRDISHPAKVRAIAGRDALHVRVECELPEGAGPFEPVTQAEHVLARECVELAIDPTGTRESFYRFVVGPAVGSRYTGATGLIDDPLDPLFGQEDPAWTGDWLSQARVDAPRGRWIAFVSIPYGTVGAERPAEGVVWRGNVARTHVAPGRRIERSIWSANPETESALDSRAFGEIAFGAVEPLSPVEAARLRQRNRRFYLYENSFEIPAEWETLPNRLDEPWESWVFQIDPADRGVGEEWHSPGFDDGEWLPIEVPAFWRETYVGDYLGYGWYRARFTVPEEWEGRPIRLSFGSIDGQAWIYINGELARERTEESEGARIDELWELPFTATVAPDLLRYGDEPNVMAVRVYKARGNAGIWRPVLMHALEEGE